MGFDDGTIRVSILTIEEQEVKLMVVYATKPHDKPITKITMNPSNTILVTGGEDCTIFFFQVLAKTNVELVPIGYIRVPNIVTCMTWHCQKVSPTNTTTSTESVTRRTSFWLGVSTEKSSK